MKLLFTLLIAFLIVQTSQSQNVGIGTNDPKARLDIAAINEGVLIPRVALTSTNVSTPLTAPETSELVYNTATAGTSPNNVVPGYYYWNGSNWVAFGGSGGRDWGLTGNAGTTASTAAIGNAVNNNFIGTTDNTSFVLATNNFERLRIAEDGNVGIGTITPKDLLQIGSMYAFHNGGQKGFAYNGYFDGSNWKYLQNGYWSGIFNSSTGDINMYVGATGTAGANVTGISAGIHLLNNGNVGIGTTAPRALLHVSSGTAANPTFTLNPVDVAYFQKEAGNAAVQLISADGTQSQYAFSTPTARQRALIGYNHSGNYLTFVAETNEGMRLYRGASDILLQLRSQAVGNWTRIGTNGSPLAILTDGVNDISGGSPALFVNNNGNVGIGDYSPSVRLDVNGSLRIRSAGDAAGNIRFDATQPYITSGGSYIHVKNGFYLYDAAQPSYTEAVFNFRNAIQNDAGNFGGALRVNDDFEVTGWISSFGKTDHVRGISLESFETAWSTLRSETDFRINVSNGGQWPERFRIKRYTGYVGIGTDNPDQLLTVNGNASKSGGGTWATFSDKRVKSNILRFEDGLSIIMQLSPISFQYNELSGYTDNDKKHIGFIAQEVENIAPYMVEKYNDTEGASGLPDKRQFDESALTKILVNAIKEQQVQIENLKKENQELKTENKISDKKYNELKTSLEKLESYIYSEAKK